MPGLDRTGPQFMGPRTGRGLGRCQTADAGAYRGFGGRSCRRFGAGRGRGLGPAFPAGGAFAMSKDEEIAMLKAEAEYARKSLDSITKQLEILEKQK